MLEMTALYSESMMAIGFLALLIGVVTELTKNVGALKKLPTDLQAMVSGIVFALAYMVYSNASQGLDFHWYQAIAAVIQGLLAAFVASYGWTKLEQMGRRLEKEKGEEK
ncbi:MAG: hypothetical protein IJP07_00200 [Firmicutes bacterium]|nr:hypothetical protein [Bacillota bacterium]